MRRRDPRRQRARPWPHPRRGVPGTHEKTPGLAVSRTAGPGASGLTARRVARRDQPSSEAGGLKRSP
ncbi:hypothetical protein C1S81_18530 [Mycolicibacterium neoaurum]|nr:hypothetical protein C1S81_18530 [Mycolicibacterium neoaurum]